MNVKQNSGQMFLIIRWSTIIYFREEELLFVNKCIRILFLELLVAYICVLSTLLLVTYVIIQLLGGNTIVWSIATIGIATVRIIRYM